jgi:hypothetical protein
VQWVDIQDTSGPKLKSSLVTSSEYSEEELVSQLRKELEVWLEEQTSFGNALPYELSSLIPTCTIDQQLGVGRFARVVVANLFPAATSSPMAVALKISTFANTPDDITEEVL